MFDFEIKVEMYGLAGFQGLKIPQVNSLHFKIEGRTINRKKHSQISCIMTNFTEN